MASWYGTVVPFVVALPVLCQVTECLKTGHEAELNLSAALPPLKSHVYVDPGRMRWKVAGSGGDWRRKVIVADGQGAHMGELAVERLVNGVQAEPPASAYDTQLYFGLSGRCAVVAAGERAALARGVSVLVRPGSRHSLEGPAGHSLQGKEPCQLLSVALHSGPWQDGGKGPALRRADDGELPSENTSHNSTLLSKRVHAKRGLVPGLKQLSVARFEPKAECELHHHATATEVYVNYGGKGCHLSVFDNSTTVKRTDSYDISGGMVDIINPGSWHEAWNDAEEHCENINIMLADP